MPAHNSRLARSTRDRVPRPPWRKNGRDRPPTPPPSASPPLAPAVTPTSRPLPRRYATFDRDILINRILAAALDVLAGCALSPALKARLSACALTFPEMSVASIRAVDCDRVTLGRSTARYRGALLLARLILEQKAPELRAGAHQVFALLFDMNALWERYVGWLFRRAIPRRDGLSSSAAPMDASPSERTRALVSAARGRQAPGPAPQKARRAPGLRPRAWQGGGTCRRPNARPRASARSDR